MRYENLRFDTLLRQVLETYRRLPVSGKWYLRLCVDGNRKVFASQ